MAPILAQVPEVLYGETVDCHPGAIRRWWGWPTRLRVATCLAVFVWTVWGLASLMLPAAAQFVVPASQPDALLDRHYDFGPAPPRAERGIRVPRLTGRLSRAQLGLIINTDDPYSVTVGAYYIEARGLSEAQVLRLKLPVRPALTPAEFTAFAAAVDARFGAPIEALALAWSQPYAVNCNSITGALALGYDAALCDHTCSQSAHSPYFNSATLRPLEDFRFRPSMLLAAGDAETAKAMIRRGVASDGSLGLRGGMPSNAYFVVTDDAPRSVRAPLFPPAGLLAAAGVAVRRVNGHSIGSADRVLLYETGLPAVPDLGEVRWVNGALADHLTSFGGVLDGSLGQMTALEWIAAGATASYGTVSEPCAIVQKFPHPQVLLLNYLQGATAIEAYWRSVAWPQQGLFVGEPLAAPFARR